MTDKAKELLLKLLVKEFENTQNLPWTEDILFEIIYTVYEIGDQNAGHDLEMQLHPDQRRRLLNLKPN